MCTNGTTDILIIATSLGSLMLYDFKNYVNQNPLRNSQLNYLALLEASVKDWANIDPVKQ